MTPDQELLRDAYLAEMWKPCRELTRHERAAKRQADWEARIELADRSAQVSVDSTDPPGTTAA